MNTIIMLQWALLQGKFKRLEKLAPVSLSRSKVHGLINIKLMLEDTAHCGWHCSPGVIDMYEGRKSVKR